MGWRVWRSPGPVAEKEIATSGQRLRPGCFVISQTVGQGATRLGNAGGTARFIIGAAPAKAEIHRDHFVGRNVTQPAIAVTPAGKGGDREPNGFRQGSLGRFDRGTPEFALRTAYLEIELNPGRVAATCRVEHDIAQGVALYRIAGESLRVVDLDVDDREYGRGFG